jgi:hypothetical protein
MTALGFIAAPALILMLALAIAWLGLHWDNRS